MINHKINR